MHSWNLFQFNSSVVKLHLSSGVVTLIKTRLKISFEKEFEFQCLAKYIPLMQDNTSFNK